MKRKIIACIYIVVVLVCCFIMFDYIFWYNSGNRYYNQMNYEAAAKAYEKALSANPPEGKECPVRINLALSMVMGLGDDYDEPDNIQNSIDVLKQAREILLEEKCATPGGVGHSDKAERLKEDIERLISELEKQLQEGGDPNDGDNKTDEKQSREDELEQSIKEELQKIQSNAYQERQEQLQFSEELDMEINFDFDTPIW